MRGRCLLLIAADFGAWDVEIIRLKDNNYSNRLYEPDKQETPYFQVLPAVFPRIGSAEN